MIHAAAISTERVLLSQLDGFLLGWFHYQNGGVESYAACFDIPEPVPAAFENMLGHLLELYENFDIEPIDAFLMAVGGLEHLAIFLDPPASEYGLDEPDKTFCEQAPSLYLLHALVLFNQTLPALQVGGVAALPAAQLLTLQQAVEHAVAANSCSSMMQRYASQHIRQAKNGGKARAEKLYGKTKAYAEQRFREIRAKGSSLSMSQIALKLADELEHNPIAGDEPLSNPYDTIYRWVRVMNRSSV
jgi:cytochrome c553